MIGLISSRCAELNNISLSSVFFGIPKSHFEHFQGRNSLIFPLTIYLKSVYCVIKIAVLIQIFLGEKVIGTGWIEDVNNNI